MKDFSTFKTVVLRFPASLAIELSEQKYYYGFIEEKTSTDFVEMTFITDSFHWMTQWVMAFGNKVKIVSPQEFTDYIKERIAELSKLYL
jgi:predicted DNA-binding transcriptional regulator YafY